MREITIHTLGEFIDQLTPAAPDPETGRRRDTGVYHGATEADAALLTSLDRLGGTTPPHTKRELEEHIFRNFLRYSRPYLPASLTNDWELLVAAQHHGVPTRLLDWTYSPLVAAFFATRPGSRHTWALPEPSVEQPRAIWRLDWHALHDAFKVPRLALRIEELGKAFQHESLTPWELFNTNAEERTFACLIEPPSLDARVVAQAAAFTLCTSTTESFDQFLDKHHLNEALTKFIIPGETVARVRDQLDLVGIDERHLFPDLDGVSATLRRYYM